MPCTMCADPYDGMCIYPYYGLAPHYEKWPKNFIENENEPGFGVYTHCLSCGDSLKPKEVVNSAENRTHDSRS